MMDATTRAERVATLRKYAEDLNHTAWAYLRAASAPGLPGGWKGRAASHLKLEAERLTSEAKTVSRQADEWEAH